MPDAPAPADQLPAPGGTGAAVPVLGLVTAGALASFARLADDAVNAPDAGARLTLSRMATGELAHLDELEAAVSACGGRPTDAVAPFLPLLADFDVRTAPRDWWERLMRSYVAGGMVVDLQRAMSQGLPGALGALARDALVENGHADYVVRTLAPVVEAEPQLAARLALWGRRVAGEALSLARAVAHACPVPDADDVTRGGAAAGEAGVGGTNVAAAGETGDAAVTALLGAMTGGHARRMGRLGLTA